MVTRGHQITLIFWWKNLSSDEEEEWLAKSQSALGV